MNSINFRHGPWYCRRVANLHAIQSYCPWSGLTAVAIDQDHHHMAIGTHCQDETRRCPVSGKARSQLSLKRTSSQPCRRNSWLGPFLELERETAMFPRGSMFYPPHHTSPILGRTRPTASGSRTTYNIRRFFLLSNFFFFSGY